MLRLLVLSFLLAVPADPVCALSHREHAYRLALQDDAFQRGLAALKTGKYADALDALTIAESRHPDDPRIRNFRGIALAHLGQDGKATEEYREAVRLDPGLEDAYRNLGFMEWNDRHLEAAREALERAVQLAPADAFAHYYLGRVDLDLQRYAQAIQELNKPEVPSPPDAAFSIQLAAAYLAVARGGDAAKLLDHLASQPLSGRQTIQVASLLIAVRHKDVAVALVQQLNRSSANSEWTKFDLALVYLLAGYDEKAILQAQASVESVPQPAKTSPGTAPAWSLIGIAYARLKQGDQSVNAFRQAAANAPSEEEQWLNLTRELMDLSRFSEAISAVQSGLVAIPKSYALNLRLGAAQLSAGHYAEAESVFRDLVTAGDPLPTGYVGMAQVLMRTGRADEAANELAEAEKKIGPNFLISYFRGLSLARAAKPSEARSAFQEALRLNANSAEAHLNLGKTQLALNQSAEAITEFEQTLHLSPGNVQAKRLLSQAYRRKGDGDNAVKFAEASRAAPVDPESDLLEDFFVPHWQQPSDNSRSASVP
ncbi:MAG TPA: tetratricopeptide repeat protein [Terriglobales bacterium]|nr:tetratricopeptide repeat protein [Terriglobales bacterium]